MIVVFGAAVPAAAQPAPVPAVASPPKAAAPGSDALQVAFTQVAEFASKTVVSLRVESRRKLSNPFERLPFGEWFMPRGHEQYRIQRDTGSGVVVGSEGYILTNGHVVQDATHVEVVFHDGRRLTGKTVGLDEATDLAVVKVEASGLPVARFADSSQVRVGQWAIAIGSPFGLDYTVTVGVVSATGRGGMGQSEIEDYLQTDASINPGNSGGPLVNLHGEVLGINTMIVGGSTGIGFAIPASLARLVSRQLIERGSVRRPFIGLDFQPLIPELAAQFGVQSGALVSGVARPSPAAKAGVRVGDVIVSLDGAPIQASRELMRMFWGQPVGSRLRLGLVRDGQRLELTVVAAERPGAKRARASGRAARAARPEAKQLGLTLQTLTPELALRLGVRGVRGALVVSVVRGSIADRAGLEEGDLIVEADKRPVSVAADVNAALADGRALVRVLRAGGAKYVVISRPE